LIEGLSLLVVIAMAVIAAIANFRIPENRIPMQWRFDGRPAWFAPRVGRI